MKDKQVRNFDLMMIISFVIMSTLMAFVAVKHTDPWLTIKVYEDSISLNTPTGVWPNTQNKVIMNQSYKIVITKLDK